MALSWSNSNSSMDNVQADEPKTRQLQEIGGLIAITPMCRQINRRGTANFAVTPHNVFGNLQLSQFYPACADEEAAGSGSIPVTCSNRSTYSGTFVPSIRSHTLKYKLKLPRNFS